MQVQSELTCPIREARKTLKLSVWDVARRTGISKNRLDKMFTGQLKTVLEFEVERLTTVLQLTREVFLKALQDLKVANYAFDAAAG